MVPGSRRQFLWGAIGATAGVLCGCCAAGGPDPEQVRAEAERYDPELDCTDVTGLFPAEVQTRLDNEYVQHSTHELQFCFNCNNFQPAATPGACGACTTVKGPIQPLGWCKSWTEKRS